MTDNWVELSVRFLTHDRNVRIVKDAMFRDIFKRLREERIAIASGTYEIVGFPPVTVKLEPETPR